MQSKIPQNANYERFSNQGINETCYDLYNRFLRNHFVPDRILYVCRYFLILFDNELSLPSFVEQLSGFKDYCFSDVQTGYKIKRRSECLWRKSNLMHAIHEYTVGLKEKEIQSSYSTLNYKT